MSSKHPALVTELLLQNVLDPTSETHVKAQIIPSPAGDLLPVNWSVLKRLFPELQNIAVPVQAPGSVQMIVGMNYKELHRPIKEIRLMEPNTSDAKQTVLGWTVAGPFARATSHTPTSRAVYCAQIRQQIARGISTQLQDVGSVISRAGGEPGSEVQLVSNVELEQLLNCAWVMGLLRLRTHLTLP